MKKNWSTVDILRHSRHDWLNNLQLIKGNLDLNKLERVKEIIEEIIIEAQQEAKLTNLNIPDVAGRLLTFNWERHYFQLEFEILGEVQNLADFDCCIAEWLVLFFQTMDQVVEIEGENHLSITIDLNEQIRFFFDFNGIIKEKDKLIVWIQRNEQNDCLHLFKKSIHNNEFSFVFKLK